MQQGIKTRIEKLEAAHRPPEPTWAIGVEWVAGWGRPNARVVAETPARLIEPGQPFDYRQVIDDIALAHAAMADIDDSLFWDDSDMVEEDDEEL